MTDSDDLTGRNWRIGSEVFLTNLSHDTLDRASSAIENEARVNKLPGTNFKRINTLREAQEGSFQATNQFLCCEPIGTSMRSSIPAVWSPEVH